MDEYLLKLPKGCRLGIRGDGSSRILPPLAKVIDTQIAPRSITKAEFEAMTAKRPEQSHQDFKSVLEGRIKDQAAIEREYMGTFLLKMRDAAKDLTAQSGFSDEAIACWENGLDELVAATARFI